MRTALTRGRGQGEQQTTGDLAPDWVTGARPASDPANPAIAGGGAGGPADSGPWRGRPALPPGLAAATAARARKLATATAAGARRQPLEATAIVLLGLGGLIYPPVWLMGALVALASRVWDHRDKWIGLGGPVLLVIAGVAADISLDTERNLLGYLKEAWLFGGHICRIAALLGAVYLAWRAQRGRRPPAVPPWNKPRRIV
jgi:hypothetical protein